ncbi:MULTISPECIES: cyclase family protein [Sphingobacterium]|uniref:Cyclase n=1 Tax=Sphingobacterium cellulitidis TaxID=1768011 RepID=A0A8H9KT20_9SPHI|nr:MULTISPECIES: cyclase family protein [Sphingobacterium]MBA8985433.1 kynurenine formamidase [Sphingobacterium soli]WFB63855.1 cyclase family protein [Sphingobacterium sp. WM]GGE09697.1 cyclase [Sphingobacterium soli]
MQSLQDIISSGSIRFVDMTHTLNESFPGLPLPAEFGQVATFKKTEISRYNELGPGWYWNNISLGEHFGTHFDAPVHWVTGKDYKNNTVDTIPTEHFMAAAQVIDASKEVAANPDFVLTPEFIQEWEAKHGELRAKEWVLFRTDWHKRAIGPEFLNQGEDGLNHTPGPSKEAVEYLISKDVLGFGVETLNTDAGMSFVWDFPLPCHTLMHGAGKYGLQCLRNLDQLPARGAVVVAAPLKIEDGSGSPLRVFAIVEG